MRGQLFSKNYSKTGSTEEAKINPFYHNFLLIASEKVFTSSFLKKVGSMIFFSFRNCIAGSMSVPNFIAS